MERVCSKCHDNKYLLTDFHKDSSRTNAGLGFSYICKDCDSNKYKAYYVKTNHRNSRKDSLRIDYKLSLEGFAALLIACENKCGICKKEFSEKRQPCVDHDHKCCPKTTTCGKCIRGLLCRKCNAGIGFLEDNKDSLKNALDWVSKERTN